MTTFYVPVDRTAGSPLHRQIYEGYRRAILEGLLRPGQRVPSTRALALELAVSRQPVLTAYEQLLHEGYLDGRKGSGTFVSAALPDDLLRAPLAARALRPRRQLRTPSGERGPGELGPFRMSLPALDRFPHTVWARLVARHAHALTHSEMAYGDAAGLPSLREAIAEHLRTARAANCEAEQVLVVSGSQAAFHLIAAALLERGERVAVEEPCYPGARTALGTGGAELVGVPVDDEGISVTSLQRLKRRVRAVYVTPSHQYPLGISMSAARRLALLDWSFREGAWLLEDDYDSEYRYVSQPLGALQGMDSHERVIYIGTFSKVLFPAVRVGYVVVPPLLRERFIRAREAFDLFSPTLYQLALAEFLREGHFARHLRRMRGIYLQRRNALLAGLARHCADRLTVYNADAGLHLAVLLARGANDTDVVQRMARRGLTATALSTCYSGPGGRSGLLLGFGGSSERRLQHATRVLGEILRAGPLPPESGLLETM
jgi:GntR family transcriptional regulator/MocR family aminotransferase